MNRSTGRVRWQVASRGGPSARATSTGSKLYRLELAGTPGGPGRTIEFAAEGRESAFQAVQRQGGGQDVAVFEDGLPLARVRYSRRHGFWTIAGKRA